MKSVRPLKPIVKSVFADQRGDRSHELLVSVSVKIDDRKPEIKQMFIRADQIARIVEIDAEYSAYILDDGLIVPVEGNIIEARKKAYNMVGENGYADLSLVTRNGALNAPDIKLLNGKVAVKKAPKDDGDNDFTIGLWVHDQEGKRYQFVELKKSTIIDIHQMPDADQRTCLFVRGRGWSFSGSGHSFYGTRSFWCTAIKPTEFVDLLKRAEKDGGDYLDLSRESAIYLPESQIQRHRKPPKPPVKPQG